MLRNVWNCPSIHCRCTSNLTSFCRICSTDIVWKQEIFGYKYIRIPLFYKARRCSNYNYKYHQFAAPLLPHELQNWIMLWNLFPSKFRTTIHYSFSKCPIEVFLKQTTPCYCIYAPLMKSDKAKDRRHDNKNTSIFAIKKNNSQILAIFIISNSIVHVRVQMYIKKTLRSL